MAAPVQVLACRRAVACQATLRTLQFRVDPAHDTLVTARQCQQRELKKQLPQALGRQKVSKHTGLGRQLQEALLPQTQSPASSHNPPGRGRVTCFTKKGKLQAMDSGTPV